MKRIDKQSAVANLDFTGIYNAYYNEILNYISYKTFGSSDTEDITSDVFVKVLNGLKSFDSSKASFSTWIHFIANNAIVDHYRKNGAEKRPVSIDIFGVIDEDDNSNRLEPVTDEDSANDVENTELKNSISKAFNSLKPNYQRIATLFFLEEKKYDEIAEICNIPMGSVKGMISRCRAMLQSELQSKKVEYCLA